MRDRFAEQAGITIEEVRDGYARCEMPVTDSHLNASDYVMGGAIYTLADLTASAASNLNHPVTVSLNGQISYLRAARCRKLIAEAECPYDGRHTNYTEVTVKDEEGTLIARAAFTGYRILPH